MMMTIETKPYLQDLFDHMRNEHRLILLQSEMQEIVSICNTDLNSENEKLRDVLREALQVISDISDPIAYLKIKMPKEGYKFDLHGAVEFSNNGMSISQMAKDALPKLEAKAKQLITEP
ncbi:hypothetical protein E2605_07715 [Dysgonomonas capnocytophagoides]|uniref:Uncharacterized protein n=1 Tax=Dysgonomonas capnocytophagoides TaxID=45254 RepID=A0A4Y8L3Q4_9BACT|nr:hypothetical protein [Dysgonomonas capnocytophagoides]TFD96698.1 hypothetical protein E2605_07715 [Dysgonomonas capnocytophagoides]